MYAMNYAQVGTNIQNELKKSGLKQTDLAVKLNISKQVMHKIIKGTKAISVTEIASIATILNTTIDELLKMNISVQQSDILNYMEQLQDEETHKLIDILRTAIDEIYMLEDL